MRTEPRPEDVWTFLIERGIDDGVDIHLFWHEAGAVDAARRHLSDCFPTEDLDGADAVYEAIERANHRVGTPEYLVLANFPVA